MLTAIYHIMVNFVNKLFRRFRIKFIKKYDVLVKKVNRFEDDISISDIDFKIKLNILKTN